jgi:thiosulfate/3-mercaptopyruvate sulfurtransferase
MPSLLTGEGKLMSPTQIKEAFAAANIDTEKPIVFSCGGGVMASVLQLASAEIGCKNTKVYDGSWGEYSQRIKA